VKSDTVALSDPGDDCAGQDNFYFSSHQNSDMAVCLR